MKTQGKYFEYLLLVIQLIPLVFVLVNWSRLPDRIPLHWDLNGDVNDWGGRYSIFLGPGLGLFVYVLLRLMPKIDPKRASYVSSAKAYGSFRLAMQVFLAAITVFTCLYSIGVKMDIGLLVRMAVLVLLLILGNYLGNIRHNYLFGVRTPWTLANETVWTRTHRFTARLWVWTTLPMFVVIGLWPKLGWPFLAYIAVIAVVPIVYSYVQFRHQKPQA